MGSSNVRWDMKKPALEVDGLEDRIPGRGHDEGTELV